MAKYAWANIKLHDRLIRAGEEVTKDDVGDDWNDFVANGTIRDNSLPKNMRSGESPKSAMLRAAREQFEAAQAPYSVATTDDEEEPESGNNEDVNNPTP